MFIFVKFSIFFGIFLLDFDWFKFLPIILPLILSVAFFTLFERKVLSAMQRRRGPMSLVCMVYYKPLLMVLN